MLHMVETALPVFLTILLGMLCRRRSIFTPEGIAALKRTAVDLCLPFVLFASLSTADYSSGALLIPVVIYAACVLMLLLGFAAKKLTRGTSAVSPYLMTGFEAGMLGYGLFALLYKDTGTAPFAIVDLGQVLFVFTLYKFLLVRQSGSGSALKDAVTSPVLWAIALGFIVGVTGLMRVIGDWANIVTSVTGFMSAPVSVLILLSIGYDLVPKNIRWKNIGLYIVERVMIAGAVLGLMLLVNRFLLHGIMHVGALTLLFMLPPPYVLPMFADAEDEKADISSALSVLTLLSLVLFTVMTAMV